MHLCIAKASPHGKGGGWDSISCDSLRKDIGSGNRTKSESSPSTTFEDDEDDDEDDDEEGHIRDNRGRSFVKQY